MTKLPNIEVSFFFTGNDFNVVDITNKMLLNPSETREKNDFPMQEFAHTEWILTTERESCKVLSWKLMKLMQLLSGKEVVINHICSSLGISVGFCVTIWMENGDKPEMVLTKEIVAFLASINGEIGFDLYMY